MTAGDGLRMQVVLFGTERNRRGEKVSSENTGLISVVIPVYNVEKYIRQCLDSVIGQTYRKLEIILIDDGSPDNCGKICDEYAQRDARIKVVHKKNGGLSAARNDGICMAKGEWITFADSDDWLDIDSYESVFEAMKGFDGDIICDGGSFYEYETKSSKRYSFDKQEVFEGKDRTDLMMAHTLSGFYDGPSGGFLHTSGSMWGKFYKSSFLAETQLRVNTDFHAFEDLLFNFIAFDKAKRVGVCTQIGYHYRQGVNTSIGHKFNPRKPQMSLDFMNELNRYMQQRQPNKVVMQAIHSRGIKSFAMLLQSHFFHKENPNTPREIARQIKMLKEEPAYHDAIYSGPSKFLNKKCVILKYLLRLPWIWPLKLVCWLQYGIPR